MTQVNFADVIESVPSFTSDQLKQLQGIAAHFLSGSPGEDSGPDEGEKDILYAMSKAAENEGIRLNMSYALLKGIPSWRKRIEDLNDFVRYFEAKCKIKLSKNEHQMLLRLLFKLLICDLKKLNICVTPRTVVTNLSRISEVFDRNFPDYMSSGLAYFVIKNNTKSKRG